MNPVNNSTFAVPAAFVCSEADLGQLVKCRANDLPKLFSSIGSVSFMPTRHGAFNAVIMAGLPGDFTYVTPLYARTEDLGDGRLVLIQDNSIPGIPTDLEKFIDAFRKVRSALEVYLDLGLQRTRLREKLLKNKLLDDNAETTVSIEYSGYGDSGQIDQYADGDEVGDAEGAAELSEFLWQLMWDRHSGFENNEGGNGTVTWDFVSDTITVEHNDAVITYETTVTEL